MENFKSDFPIETLYTLTVPFYEDEKLLAITFNNQMSIGANVTLKMLLVNLPKHIPRITPLIALDFVSPFTGQRLFRRTMRGNSIYMFKKYFKEYQENGYAQLVNRFDVDTGKKISYSWQLYPAPVADSFSILRQDGKLVDGEWVAFNEPHFSL